MPTAAHDLSVTPLGRPYTVFVFLVLVIVGCFVGAVSGADLPTFEEDGPVERAQILLWAIASIAGVILSLSAATRSTRCYLLVLASLAGLAVARELDAHIYLNPEKLGSLGVRYRIDWWLDGSVSLLLKAAWALVALVSIAAVLGPAFFARDAILRTIRLRTLPFWLLGATGLCLFVGFAVDDLLRNRIDLQIGHAIEESVELAGPIFYLAAVLAIASSASTSQGRLHP